ncbi:MAG: hypothetical protein M3O30_03565 [Planctomycetota bacterium]|nr:hypothetical protein [Planctomycetota bacterium]
MVPPVLLLAAIAVGGCASNTPDILEVGPTGHVDDAKRYVPLKVQDHWPLAVAADTQTIVKRELENAKSAEFNEVPRYEAYYDKVQDVTRLSVFGNVETRDPERHVIRRGFHVVWQRPGNLRNEKVAADPDLSQPWTLEIAEVLDSPV